MATGWLLDIDLAHALLLPNDFDLIAQFIAETHARRNRFDQNERRSLIGRVDLNVLDADQAIQKRLPRLEIFDSIQFQRLRYFTENALGDLEALGRQLVNLAFRFEIMRQRDKDWHDEPAEEPA